MTLAWVSPTATATHLHFLGYDPPRQSTEFDWELETEAFSEAVETAWAGTVVERGNPENGNSPTITPPGRFNRPVGGPCRRINATFESKPYQSQYAVTVCRNADGNRKVTRTD
jgi:surface antigen